MKWVPPQSPPQSCCLRCAECSGLPVPEHPVGPHSLPGDCTPGGRFAAPTAGPTVGRQVALVRTQSQPASCPKTLAQNVWNGVPDQSLSRVPGVRDDPSLSGHPFTTDRSMVPSEGRFQVQPFVHFKMWRESHDSKTHLQQVLSLPNPTPHPPTPCKGSTPHLFVWPQLWCGTTGVLTG